MENKVIEYKIVDREAVVDYLCDYEYDLWEWETVAEIIRSGVNIVGFGNMDDEELIIELWEIEAIELAASKGWIEEYRNV